MEADLSRLEKENRLNVLNMGKQRDETDRLKEIERSVLAANRELHEEKDKLEDQLSSMKEQNTRLIMMFESDPTTLQEMPQEKKQAL